MMLILAFAAALLLAVYISGLARRSVISTAVLFLTVGAILGNFVSGSIPDQPGPAIRRFIELALFAMLFTEGMNTGFSDLRSAWRLPGRALFFGMPLTLGITAALARLVAGLDWAQSLLIGAALSATDPVLASAIVGRQEVPARLRSLLNVESGMNDGLALPLVVGMLHLLRAEQIRPADLAAQVGLGIALGVSVAAAAILIGRGRFTTAARYEPLYAAAIGLLVFGLAQLAGVNSFLAAFSAGIVIASLEPKIRDSFHILGESAGELLKLSTLMLFGALISPSFLAGLDIGAYAFALLAFVAARPIALGISLLGSSLTARERLAAAWFGPRGFSTMLYSLLILSSGIASAQKLFHIIAVIIVASILVYSSSDPLVARLFQGERSTDGERPASA